MEWNRWRGLRFDYMAVSTDLRAKCIRFVVTDILRPIMPGIRSILNSHSTNMPFNSHHRFQSSFTSQFGNSEWTRASQRSKRNSHAWRSPFAYGNVQCYGSMIHIGVCRECIFRMPKFIRDRAAKMENQINNKNETENTETDPTDEENISFLIENIFSVVNHSCVELLLAPSLAVFVFISLRSMFFWFLFVWFTAYDGTRSP